MISDNGCGIPSHELEAIKKGKSLKVDGNGIGMPSAIEYIESIGGAFEIESTENIGTKIILTLPYIKTPKWRIDKIDIFKYQIIIVDNDPEIITIWQRKLLPRTRNVKYFSGSKMFLEWLSEQSQTDINGSLILMDYELGENDIFGLDLLLKNNIPNAIIVTDYAEHAWLQNQVEKTKYYLLPKSTI